MKNEHPNTFELVNAWVERNFGRLSQPLIMGYNMVLELADLEREYRKATSMADSEERVCQACPECEAGEEAMGASTVLRSRTVLVSCWRCGGDGLVDPYDDSMPTIIDRRSST